MLPPKTPEIICGPRTLEGARRSVRQLKRLISRRLPWDQWVRLRNPTQAQIEFARAIYNEPEKEIARLIETFGPEVEA